MNANLHAQAAINTGLPTETNSPSLESLLQQYQPLAAYFLDKMSWNGPNFLTLNDSEKSKYSTLQSLANQLAASPDAHDVIPQLLTSYEDHDGYTRQALFYAVRDANYSKHDLPYLKQLFMISLKCKRATIQIIYMVG